MLHNFINLEKWNALTPTYKSIVKTASMAAHEWMQAKYDAANPAALKRLVAAGAQLRPFPPSVMDACLKASLELYNEVSATNADFKKVWESTLAFRNDQYLWWQVAELGLEDSRWRKLRTRNGDAGWVPDWLRKRAADPRDASHFVDGWSHLCSEGATWPADPMARDA